jgi:hypothetical protein
MKIVRFLISIFYFLILSSLGWQCSSWMGDAVGFDDNIVVFADSSDWNIYQDALNSVFGKQIKMPAVERDFILKWAPFRDFERYRNQKNIFILGRLDSNDPVSQNIHELLSPEIIEGVKTGQYFFIPKQEPWALNQYLLLLIANSRDDMIQKIHDLGDLLYSDFRKFYYQRLKEQMFAQQEQKNLENYLVKNYPFMIRIQHDYFIADENLQEGYVWLRRVQPDRSLLISWRPVPEDFNLTSRWVINERNRLAKKIYQGDVVVEEETKAYEVQFKKWNSIRLEGTWRNDQYVVGGPFRNLTFIDKESNLIYSLDFYVQAIGKRKKPYLDQLDVIIHTFEVNEHGVSKVAS